MKNTLTDLNNYLFETLEKLTDDDLADEELEREIKRSEAVTRVATTVISNGELALKTMKHFYEAGIDVATPTMLSIEAKK
jgi:hypothetical protein